MMCGFYLNNNYDLFRRRGYTASIIHRFCEQIGVSTAQVVTTHMHVLESVARDEFDTSAPRAFAVLEPLKVRLSRCRLE